ncbi:MAG: polyribonucleotide nucleotidyltransferase [Gemmatimonadales bacterium]
MVKHVERSFDGRTYRMETGRLAKQAAGSAVVQFGDTLVLSAVTVSDRESNLPFFPLTVEYRDKSYAAGKIPGGFFKREGRPGEAEILAARLIDRSIRPLFPKGFKNEVQVYVYVLSADQENDADILGLTAASLSLSLSNAPWSGPVAGVRVARVDGAWVLNPTFMQLDQSDMDLVVAGRSDSLMMVEGGAHEIDEEAVAEALEFAQSGIAQLVEMENEIVQAAAITKMEWVAHEPSDEIVRKVGELAGDRVERVLNQPEKAERAQAVAAVRDDVLEQLSEEFEDELDDARAVFDQIEYDTMRRQVLDQGERVDGRGLDTVRPITCEVGFLPRAHGSAVFTRGQTQALVSTTLGTVADEQRIDNIHIAEETTKSFMLHYNFPSFSVGEVRPVRGVSRREIGHGNLAERALQPLLPSYDDFPYTIRVVSEILESNGSSSMATVCGGSLAMMDAGVPLKAPCAGVAMGLIKEGDRVAVLTDILGSEDHLGDMDFKVAGTREGVTSIQMDIKIEGISLAILRDALGRARKARLHILDIMSETLAQARDTMSQYAPRIITVKVKPEKIGDVIGPKGKIIRGIQEQTGAVINVDDTGLVTISALEGKGGEQARQMIEAIVQEPEVGKTYEGVVKSTTQFGAFVEIIPGVEGLLHISELQHERTNRTEDVVKKGDTVKVKLLEVDSRGKMRLSRKALLEKPDTVKQSS